MEIKTNLKVGDKVWWVKDVGRKIMVHEAVVEEISLCEYQGALYCVLHSPTNKINPYPNVHYSFVFPSREAAEEFRDTLRKIEKGTVPMCYGCVHAWKGRG